MRRITAAPRPNWKSEVESLGFTFHTIDGDTYWDESGWFEFSLKEIEEFELATNVMHDLCLRAVQVVIENDRFDEFRIPVAYRDCIRSSWENDEPTLYGRFDFAWDGVSPPKMLEYNADTPTGLFEASVVQWNWLESVHPGCDQFNSLHEKLIDIWGRFLDAGTRRVDFAATEFHEEDFGNVTYLQDTASQAGIVTEYLDMSAIGFDSTRRLFVDTKNAPLNSVFKLYPWEWMLQEPFAPHLLETQTDWIEPPWKMVLSNKALLVVLWELFPSCEYVLPAAWKPLSGDFVRKPILAREGSNIQVFEKGRATRQTDGPYADQPTVYQKHHPLFETEQGYAVMGGWIVGDTAAGLGIREDLNPITHNLSRFIPHVIR